MLDLSIPAHHPVVVLARGVAGRFSLEFRENQRKEKQVYW